MATARKKPLTLQGIQAVLEVHQVGIAYSERGAAQGMCMCGWTSHTTALVPLDEKDRHAMEEHVARLMAAHQTERIDAEGRG